MGKIMHACMQGINQDIYVNERVTEHVTSCHGCACTSPPVLFDQPSHPRLVPQTLSLLQRVLVHGAISILTGWFVCFFLLGCVCVGLAFVLVFVCIHSCISVCGRCVSVYMYVYVFPSMEYRIQVFMYLWTFSSVYVRGPWMYMYHVL